MAEINPVAKAMFSPQGAMIMSSMVEAIVKAASNNCDCEVCTVLRAGDGAFGDLMDGAASDG